MKKAKAGKDAELETGGGWGTKLLYMDGGTDFFLNAK